jgi:hypothetical protein
VQSTKRCCASTRVCSENRKQDTNVLDGADFVRDVLDAYLEERQFPCGSRALECNNFA